MPRMEIGAPGLRHAPFRQIRQQDVLEQLSNVDWDRVCHHASRCTASDLVNALWAQEPAFYCDWRSGIIKVNAPCIETYGFAHGSLFGFYTDREANPNFLIATNLSFRLDHRMRMHKIGHYPFRLNSPDDEHICPRGWFGNTRNVSMQLLAAVPALRDVTIRMWRTRQDQNMLIGYIPQAVKVSCENYGKRLTRVGRILPSNLAEHEAFHYASSPIEAKFNELCCG